MILVPEETSLVVAGAWNLAILTPAWLLQHGLGRDPAAGQRVQAFLPTGPGPVFEFPRYVLDELSFSVRPDALVVTPPETTEARMLAIEEAVARVLDVLRHTPVMGVGHNFQFRQTPARVQDLQIFTDSRQDIVDRISQEWTPREAALLSTFAHESGRVAVNTTRQLDGESIIVKVNFHHPVTSTAQAIRVLRGEDGGLRMTQNLQLAVSLFQEIYGAPQA